MMNDN